MLTASETNASRKDGRGYHLTITGGDWAGKWSAGGKIAQKKAYGRGIKNGKEMYLPQISGGIIGDSCATAVLPGVFLLGKHEQESDVRRKIISGDHGTYLHALAEKYGEAVRFGKGRKTGNTQHSQRSCESDFGGRWNLCSAAEGGSVALVSL